MERALIAMSGGVDSSVAALLMKQAGFDCVGCTMKLYENEDACVSRSRTCCSLDDVEDARSVAFRLGMPYYDFNFRDEFKQQVIGKFVCSYLCGRTPNPCIDCNQFMKFHALRRRADVLGCSCIVTGHYARIENQDGRYILKKGLDSTKDQSYVLYGMTQEQLAHTRFPLGDLEKSQVRRLAEESGFLNAEKPDSQDICFVPDGDYARVIRLHSGSEFLPGDFLLPDGTVIGRHKGIIHYTIGQHRGLDLHYHEKLYVCAINAESNTVVLGHEEDLYTSELTAEEFNWISGEAPTSPLRCTVMTRYRSSEKPVTVYSLGVGKVRIVFDQPQKAVAPGQAVVLYDGDVVLGGGTICSTRPYSQE